MTRLMLTLAIIAAAIASSHSGTHAMSSHNPGRHDHQDVQRDTATSYSRNEDGSWNEHGSWSEYGSHAISSVPEVSTVVLLVSGAAGLALWVRRRK